MSAPLRKVIRRQLEERPGYGPAGISVWIVDILDCGHVQARSSYDYSPTVSRRCEPCERGEAA